MEDFQEKTYAVGFENTIMIANREFLRFKQEPVPSFSVEDITIILRWRLKQTRVGEVQPL